MLRRHGLPRPGHHQLDLERHRGGRQADPVVAGLIQQGTLDRPGPGRGTVGDPERHSHDEAALVDPQGLAGELEEDHLPVGVGRRGERHVRRRLQLQLGGNQVILAGEVGVHVPARQKVSDDAQHGGSPRMHTAQGDVRRRSHDLVRRRKLVLDGRRHPRSHQEQQGKPCAEPPGPRG